MSEEKQGTLAPLIPSKKLMRLRIYQQELLRAEEMAAEATLERLQRASALREQEAEYEFNMVRRAEIKTSLMREANIDMVRQRPSIFIGTDVFFNEDEKLWACEYCGVVAYGDTPEMACENFDHLWVFGK